MTRLTAYVPQDELPVVLSPEASTVLLERLLQEAGGTVIHGATVVVFEELDRQDVVIFADGKVRELGRHHGEKMAAQRIVDAARGRERGPGKLSRNEDHRPSLPVGTQQGSCLGAWAPYLIQGVGDEDGTWMAHDGARDRFDGNFTWASERICWERCYWLNARTDEDGSVNVCSGASVCPGPGYGCCGKGT